MKLAWTNRTLRDVLLSSKAKNIWKAARERVSPGIPVCPLDMTELEWTKLLFGGPACQVLFQTVYAAWLVLFEVPSCSVDLGMQLELISRYVEECVRAASKNSMPHFILLCP